jgi:threonine dehydratase
MQPLPTTFVEAPRLSALTGAEVLLVSETFQHGGSFKYRAAHHVASHVAASTIVCASSGNFGQAMALACKLVGKRCVVVMPETSARVKIEAVRALGATVELIDTRVVTREARVAELVAASPGAYTASAFDDPLVIEGNASLGRELAGSGRAFDAVLVPIGGGGLSSGILSGLRRAGSEAAVFAAEPALANDAARSLREGRRVALESEPRTIADGARTRCVGVHPWAILKDGLAGIVEVSEEAIGRAVYLAFAHANLKLEPTGALAIAALLEDPARFARRRVVCVCSGGNVDADLYRSLLETYAPA